MSFISSAYAQVAQSSGQGSENPLVNFLPLILIFAVFYIFLIRPQQKKMKEHEAVINSVKKGDEVITGGGIIGKVSKIEEGSNIIHIEIADGVVVRINKATIIELITKVVSQENEPEKKSEKKKKASK